MEIRRNLVFDVSMWYRRRIDMDSTWCVRWAVKSVCMVTKKFDRFVLLCVVFYFFNIFINFYSGWDTFNRNMLFHAYFSQNQFNGSFAKVNPQHLANISTSFFAYNSSNSKVITISNKHHVNWMILVPKNNHDDTLIDWWHSHMYS